MRVTLLVVMSIAFVSTHFALSRPLRAPIVARIGTGGFLIAYSLVAFVTLGGMAHAYANAPPQPFLWPVGDGLWAIASATMLIGAVLFVGSLLGNPALPDPRGATKPVPTPRGVFAITRHPMMWSFALWALVHIAVFPVAAQIVLALAILVLALVGAALQDAKKAALQPGFWPEWTRRTSYLPFAALAAGRVPWSAANPGAIARLGGLAFWLAATWAHIPLAGWAAGIWRWVG